MTPVENGNTSSARRPSPSPTQRHDCSASSMTDERFGLLHNRLTVFAALAIDRARILMREAHSFRLLFAPAAFGFLQTLGPLVLDARQHTDNFAFDRVQQFLEQFERFAFVFL